MDETHRHRHSMPTFLIRRRRLPVILMLYHRGPLCRGGREWKKEIEWSNHYYLYDEQDDNEDEYGVPAPLPHKNEEKEKTYDVYV